MSISLLVLGFFVSIGLVACTLIANDPWKERQSVYRTSGLFLRCHSLVAFTDPYGRIPEKVQSFCK